MKTINLICKIEIKSTIKNVIEILNKYCENKKDYKFFINICIPKEIGEDDFGSNVIIHTAKENQSIDDLVNSVICSSVTDYTITCAVNDKNWEHKLDKIIQNLDSGVEVCKISKLFIPKNFFFILLNFFIKLYYISINTFIDFDRNLSVTDVNFQGYTQKPILIMKNLKNQIPFIKLTDAFLVIKQKNLFLKKNNNSIIVEHLNKNRLTKNQIIALCVFMIGIIFIGVSVPLLMDIYIQKNSLFKFIILDMLIFICATTFTYYYYFKDEAKKILSIR